MDKCFKEMKKVVMEEHCPIPNMLIEMPVKKQEGHEFAGFMMVCFSFAWRAMVETDGRSEWQISNEKLKNQKGYTNNKCRKFFLRAFSLGLVTDFVELENNEMKVKINPKAYSTDKVENLKNG